MKEQPDGIGIPEYYPRERIYKSDEVKARGEYCESDYVKNRKK